MNKFPCNLTELQVHWLAPLSLDEQNKYSLTLLNISHYVLIYLDKRVTKHKNTYKITSRKQKLQ